MCLLRPFLLLLSRLFPTEALWTQLDVCCGRSSMFVMVIMVTVMVLNTAVVVMVIVMIIIMVVVLVIMVSVMVIVMVIMVLTQTSEAFVMVRMFIVIVKDR